MVCGQVAEKLILVLGCEPENVNVHSHTGDVSQKNVNVHSHAGEMGKKV